MARNRITNPAMQVNDISPHSVAASRGRGTAAGVRDTTLSAGGSSCGGNYDPKTGAYKRGPGTPAAANWDMNEGALRGTFGTDRDGFSPPNPRDANREKNPAGGEYGTNRRSRK